VHEVDDAGDGTDRPLHHQRGDPEPVPQRRDRPAQVGAGTVHLVDERDPRYAVPVGLPPDRLALRLDTGYRVEDGDRAVRVVLPASTWARMPRLRSFTHDLFGRTPYPGASDRR
jgi:hypothetical protein